MAQWKNKKCLITGATGFIGQRLVDRLINKGAELAIFILDEENGINLYPKIYRGNLTNSQDIERAVVRFAPEYVFHLAAQPLVETAMRGVVDTLNTNIIGSINLLQSCFSGSVKSVLFVTTDKVYGESKNATEMSPLNGVGHPYSASKVCADVLAQMYGHLGLPVGIVRSGNVYGGGDLNFDRIIPYACRQVLHGEPIELRSNGESLRDYLYIDDMIDGYLMLAQWVARNNTPFAMNFGSEKCYSVAEVVSTVLSVENKGIEIKVNNTAQGELDHQHLDWGAARTVLGWRPQVSFQEGIKRTYQWYKGYFNG